MVVMVANIHRGVQKMSLLGGVFQSQFDGRVEGKVLVEFL